MFLQIGIPRNNFPYYSREKKYIKWWEKKNKKKLEGFRIYSTKGPKRGEILLFPTRIKQPEQ